MFIPLARLSLRALHLTSVELTMFYDAGVLSVPPGSLPALEILAQWLNFSKNHKYKMSYRSKLIIAISNTHTHTTVDGLKYRLLSIPFHQRLHKFLVFFLAKIVIKKKN